MPIADIYVLDHVQSFLNEPLHNIYTFEKLGITDAQDLINAFQADILPKILSMQVDDVVTKAIKAYSLGDLGDLSEETFNSPGGYDLDEMLPIFNAVNFTLKPAGRAVRPGSKRISGIPESVQVNGTITNATYIGYIEALRSAYGNEVSVDDTNFWKLVIVKRVLYVVPGSSPERTAYRFPETDAELVYSALRNVTTTTKVSHQVSRGN